MLVRQPPIRTRRAVPRCWLMVDARLGDTAPAIVAAMPPRSAVVVRPYAMQTEGREELVRAIRRAARAKRHLLLVAGGGSDAGFDGTHGSGERGRRKWGFLSMPVHDRRELAQAIRQGADAMLISPVWPTRSHPQAHGIGRRGFASLAAPSPVPAIALGGMTARRFRQVRFQGAAGWAAIDAWLADDARQK